MLGQSAATCILSLASIVFYAYWSPVYIVLIIAEVLFSFFVGRTLSSPLSATAKKKTILTGSIILLLVALGYFKYTNMLLQGVDLILGPVYKMIDA